MTALGMAASGLYGQAREAKSKDELEAIERDLWRDWSAGRISDDEANEVGSRIAAMKAGRVVGRSAGAVTARLSHRLVSRQRPRSPNLAASRERRRLVGGCGGLCKELRPHYTEGQRSVLTIIASYVRLNGHCDEVIDKIAALAGVCRTTVQTTLHEARRLGHIIVQERPQPGRKSLTNIVKVASREWLAWIMRGSLKAARDRVQNANAVQKGEPHEEQRGNEESEWEPLRGAAGHREGQPRASAGPSTGREEARRSAAARSGPAPGGRRGGRGVVSDFGPFLGTGAGTNAR